MNAIHLKTKTEMDSLPLLLVEPVGDGVLDGGARALVDDGVAQGHLEEAGDHQDQVRRVTQGDRHAAIILGCGEEGTRLG